MNSTATSIVSTTDRYDLIFILYRIRRNTKQKREKLEY
jgi:hypothetical protein